MYGDDKDPAFDDELIFVQDGVPVSTDECTSVASGGMTLRLFDTGANVLPFDETSDVEILEVADDYVDVRFTGFDE